MANDSYSQQQLAQDPKFQGRVRAGLATVAWQVLNEDAAVPDHDVRARYANFVLSNLTGQAQSVAPSLVHRPNLMAFETTFDFRAAAVVSAAGDADIESQLMTDWSKMAGIQTPVAIGV
jgi:hypothetical protein